MLGLSILVYERLRELKTSCLGRQPGEVDVGMCSNLYVTFLAEFKGRAYRAGEHYTLDWGSSRSYPCGGV